MKTAHDLIVEGGLSRAAEFLRQSDAIEGIRIPVESYQQDLLSVFPEPSEDGLLMSYVQNHIWALGYVLRNHDRLPKLGDCLELHRRLMQNSNLGKWVGVFRQTAVMVNYELCPNPVSVPYAMDDLCFQLSNGFEPLAAHRQFEKIHPFVDGNGRTGRLFWMWLRLHRGEQIAPFLEACGYRGETFADQRQAYYDDLAEFKRVG